MATYFKNFVVRELLDSRVPIVSEYEFFVLTAQLAERASEKHLGIARPPSEWDRSKAKRLARKLMRAGAIVADPDFSSVWRIVNAESPGSAEEACCLVDPFCYVSHLTAMQRYGFTDRSPIHIQLTRPSRIAWNTLAKQKMAKDLAIGNLGEEVPSLIHFGFAPRVRRRPVQIYETNRPGIYRKIRGEHTRIATIERTFSDMLDECELCGGMDHVLDVWTKHAPLNIEKIISLIDDHPKKITKIRAGYIISELLKISHPRVESWKQFAQRGGSQKLDPEKPYAPNFSESWMISLNV